MAATDDAFNGINAVLGRLVEHVMTENLKPGDALPSVRDLSQRWNLGRNLIRHGLVQAQVLGVVDVHPRSGVVVRTVDYAPVVSALSQTIGLALSQHDPNLINLWQARAVIEMETAAEAARRRIPEDLRTLDRILAEMEQYDSDRPKFINADERYHLAIAQIAGNPVLRILLDTLLKLIRPFRLSVPAPDPRDQSPATHMAIYHTIGEGDAAEARRVMGEHCERFITKLMRTRRDRAG